jgi:hypothetical protein
MFRKFGYICKIIFIAYADDTIILSETEADMQRSGNKFYPCLTPISHLKNDENLSLFLIQDLILS